MLIPTIAIGTIALQIAILALIAAWIMRAPLLSLVERHTTLLLRIVSTGAVLGSLYLEYGLGYEPCLLCWYQRIAIFGVAIIAWTGDIKTNALLRKQVIIFSLLGLIVALFHNYIDIFPGSGIDVCGASTVSCLKRYIYEFGYITIPMMSLTVLLLGLLLTFLAGRSSTLPSASK